MARIRRLARPPIQEALIDIVLADPLVDDSGLEEIVNQLKLEGWQKSPIRTFVASFDLGSQAPDAAPFTSSSEIEGLTLSRPDGQIIYQIRRDRITVSHVNVYRRWEDLEADADTLLQAHVAVSGASRIQRMAARYINRLRLRSSDPREAAALLLWPPRIQEGVEEAYVADFANRQVLKGFPDDMTANMTTGTATPLPGEVVASLILDIDVFKTCDEPAAMSALLPGFGLIRDIKNRLFFGALHETALEPYE